MTLRLVRWLRAASLCLPALALAPGQTQQPASETIAIDARAPGQPFPHFWEQMFGSGRAILSLRESYRRDLRAVKSITNFEYVRFHAIFHDEVGLYDEDKQEIGRASCRERVKVYGVAVRPEKKSNDQG